MEKNTEMQWADELKKQRQSAAHRSRVPFALRKKHVTEEFDFYKKKFAEAVEQQDGNAAQTYGITLIELCAKQLGLFLEEEKKKHGGVYDEVKRARTEKYYKDCDTIVRIVEGVL
jgi:hypothetical protein